MARKHYVLISRREIANSDRFVIAIRKSFCGADVAFFSGHRISGTNKYIVRVYSGNDFVMDTFLMTRTNGNWQIRSLAAIRNCEWCLVRRFYKELTLFHANDLDLALVDGTSRTYISAEEAVINLADQLDLPARTLIGLDSAVAFAASGGEGR